MTRRAAGIPLAELRRHHIKKERQRASRYHGYFVAELTRKYGYRCLCCGHDADLRLDHIHPVSRGGSTRLSNLQLLCKPCDEAKADRIIDYRKGK